MVKRAGKSVVKKQEVLVVGNRNSMLPNGRQAARRERERKAPQRRELVPLFGQGLPRIHLIALVL